jgi:two-component system, LytTR family, sensor kinase
MSETISSLENPFIVFLQAKRWAFARHLILLLILALNYDLFAIEYIKDFTANSKISFWVFYSGQLINMAFALGLIYINLYYLFPRYLKKAQYLSYAIGVLILVVIYFFLNYFTQQVYVNHFGKESAYVISLTVSGFIGSVMYPLVFIGSTTGYKLFKVSITDQKRFAELEKEKMNTELAQLKNQVNPHFLFNTLNNLQVLVKTNPDKAADIVLGLSDVLRFQIYDGQQDRVLLSKDIDVISQYIELEKIRRDDLQVSIKVDRDKIGGVLVPPLLFTNFVDNAIKHSNSRTSSSIQLEFHVKDASLYFCIVNSKAQQKLNSQSSGLGLPNIKKRLHLLYGDSYSLDIFDEPDFFTVKLKIPI